MPPLVLDGTNGVSGVDGTASNPAIEGTDSNTGIFYPAADTVAIGTGGTEALRVNSSQQVGIGTTNPLFKLVVSKAGAEGIEFVPGGTSNVSTTQYYNRSGAAYTANVQDASYHSWLISGSERARINSDGFFKAQANSTYIGSTGTYHEFITASGNQNTAKFRSNATSGQQYGIEISTANDQNDAVRSFMQCFGAATLRAEMRANGGLANYSANNVNLASDQRLKKDISLLDTSWDKVKQIEVVNFRYKDCNEGDPLLYGVIAQQVQPIVPELVVVTQEAKEATEDAEATPEYYGIREQPMYWLAIKALQEAMTRIEALEAEVQALKGNA